MTRPKSARKASKKRAAVQVVKIDPTEFPDLSYKKPPSFDQTYPAISYWVNGRGFIEVGDDGMQPSMARALDIGGMVWEGKSHYSSIDELFRDMEAGLSAWLDQTKQPYKPKAKVKRTRKKLR